MRPPLFFDHWLGLSRYSSAPAAGRPGEPDHRHRFGGCPGAAGIRPLAALVNRITGTGSGCPGAASTSQHVMDEIERCRV